MALTFSNPVHYSTHAANTYSRVQLVTGTRSADGTPYKLLEATDKNSGAITAIRISNKITGSLKDVKEELVLSIVVDTDTSETFPMVYLRGDREAEEF